MISVGIIEDDLVLRINIEDYLKKIEDVSIVFSLNSMESFIEKRSSISEPFLIFIDLGLPGISGLEGIRLLREKWKNTHVVVVTGNDEEDTIYNCIQSGANGYLLKPFRMNELVENLQIIRDGGAIITPQVAAKLFHKLRKPIEKYENTQSGLTDREKEVVDVLLKGLAYKEIAVTLGITAGTVNDHVKKIYTKMHVNSKSELISVILNSNRNN